MEVRLLGPVELVGDAGLITLGPPKQRALFSILALEANRVVTSDRLVDLLWGESPPRTAGHSVQTYVSELRRLLPDTECRIETVRGGYRLSLDEEAIDVRRFERLVRDGIESVETGTPSEGRESLEQALALWRGEPLSDLAYEEFAHREVQRLEEVRNTAVEELHEADLALGRHRETLPNLERHARDHPFRERPRRQLMLALYRCGRHAEALQVFSDYARALGEELGIEPSEDLRLLEEQILIQDPALASSSGTPPHNLPEELTSFIGRERELAEVGRTLRHTRLLTLLGAGGVGKTRLALRAARMCLDDYPDGVWLVDMSKASADDAAPHLGQVLGLGGEDHTKDSLAAELRSRRMLLVLDNCETVSRVAGDVTRAILESAPTVRVLATSRMPLQIPGERTLIVPALSLPAEEIGCGAIDASEATRLFVDRAVAVRPGFELTSRSSREVAAICRQLDGLPLAIELAAARTRTMTTSQILTGLGDVFHLLSGGGPGVPPHHRTLEATIRWSLQHLDQRERTLLKRLRIFVWDFPLRAVELLGSGNGVAEKEVLDLITRLVDGGLVNVEEHDGEIHYRLPQTVWWFIIRTSEFDPRFDAPGYVVALAQRTEPRLRGPERAMWSTLLGGTRERVDEMLQVAYRLFTASEGSFLAGAAAAWTSQTGRVGFIGGIEIPLIQEFENGFVAGARHANPQIVVDVSYLSTPPDYSGFDSPETLFLQSEAIFALGADVIFHASGRSGPGLFEAARQVTLSTGRKHWGIGVDFDEYLEVDDELKPYVLTSMRKQVPLTVLRAIVDARRHGTEPPRLDLSNEGVGLSATGGHIDHLLPRLEELRAALIAGDIAVPAVSPPIADGT